MNDYYFYFNCIHSLIVFINFGFNLHGKYRIQSNISARRKIRPQINRTIFIKKEEGEVPSKMHRRTRNKTDRLSFFRLQALGRTAPQYTMRWRSQTVIANTRKSGPSPAPNWHGVGSSGKIEPRGTGLILVLVFAILLARPFDC